MRPGRFHPGNLPAKSRCSSRCWSCFNEAGAFPPRKLRDREPGVRHQPQASMRPGRFHPGNSRPLRVPTPSTSSNTSFNEAGAFPPRKLPLGDPRKRGGCHASMRPGRFHPGNWPCQIGFAASQCDCFNEAGAFPPRKFGEDADTIDRGGSASMRPGRFHPGNSYPPATFTLHKRCFNEAGAFPPRKLFLSPWHVNALRTLQ